MKEKIQVLFMGASASTGNMGVSALAHSSIYIIKKVCPNAEITFILSKNQNEPEKIIINGKSNIFPVIIYRMSPRSKLNDHIFYIFILACLYRIFGRIGLIEKILSKNPFIKTVSTSDVVLDIRGGDSFSDIYGFRGFVYLSLARLSVLLLKKNLVLLPQTYGPFKSRLSKFIARIILNHSQTVMARDTTSFKLAKELIRDKEKKEKVILCCDVAFLLGKKEAKKNKYRPGY